MNEQLRRRLDRLDVLRETLYSEPSCGCGGPLHIILDDHNTRDSDLVFCYRYLYDHAKEETYQVRPLCLLILHELAMLNEAQRYVWCRHYDQSEVEAAENKILISTEDGYKVDYERVAG